MLDLVKAQFKSGRAMTQARHWSVMQRSQTHPLLSDLYPWGTDYYHELNPYFLINVPRADLFTFTKLITVRDGRLPFAAMMVKNFARLQTTELGLIVHPTLAPFVPTTMLERALSWRVAQKKSLSFETAPTVLVTSIIHEGLSSEALIEKLAPLRKVRKDAKLEFFLPMRKNPLVPGWKESYLGYELIAAIKDLLPQHALKFLTVRELTERTSFRETYLFDLFDDVELIADRGLWHFVASRGGTIHGFETQAPADALFSLDLSFTHSFYVCPLPEAPNAFAELVFRHKLAPTADPILDPAFQAIVQKQRS